LSVCVCVRSRVRVCVCVSQQKDHLLEAAHAREAREGAAQLVAMQHAEVRVPVVFSTWVSDSRRRRRGTRRKEEVVSAGQSALRVFQRH